MTEPSEPAGVACPEVREYSKEFQQQLLVERLALPSSSVINEALRDYLQLRDKARACKNG